MPSVLESNCSLRVATIRTMSLHARLLSHRESDQSKRPVTVRHKLALGGQSMHVLVRRQTAHFFAAEDFCIRAGSCSDSCSISYRFSLCNREMDRNGVAVDRECQCWLKQQEKGKKQETASDPRTRRRPSQQEPLEM